MKFLNRNFPAFAVLVVALGLTVACTDQHVPKPKLDAQPASAAAGVLVETQVGVNPAGPGKETAGTTSGAKSDVTKAEQSSGMPLPGQANDHSTLDPTASTKAANPAR